MAAILREMVGSRDASAWVPLALLAMLLLYVVGFLDGSVHGSAILGDAGLKLDYLHEFVHHGRHVFMMCH